MTELASKSSFEIVLEAAEKRYWHMTNSPFIFPTKYMEELRVAIARLRALPAPNEIDKWVKHIGDCIQAITDSGVTTADVEREVRYVLCTVAHGAMSDPFDAALRRLRDEGGNPHFSFVVLYASPGLSVRKVISQHQVNSITDLPHILDEAVDALQKAKQ